MATLENFVAELVADPKLQNEVKKDPAKAVAEYVQRLPEAIQTDKVLYRITVLALGITVVSAVVGAVFLSWDGVEKTPEILTALGSAAIGALAGILVPSPVASGGK